MKRILRLLSEMTARTRLTALVFCLAVLGPEVWAQTRQISGTVTASDDKSTIPGVNILVKGTSTGTVTDADGKFTLSVDGNSAVLGVSSIGYGTQEVVVGSQSVLNIV